MRKKNLIMSIIGLFTFIFLAGGVSYAYFVYNKDVAVVDLETGNISINFNNATNKISNVTTQPINDGTGKVLPYYLDFTVNGTADTEAIFYELEIVPNSGNTIDSQYVKVYLTDQNENELLSPFLYTELLDAEKNNGKALFQDLIEGNIDGTSKTTTKNYRLRVWIDDSYDDVTGGSFSFSVYLYAKNIDTTNLEKVTFNTQDGRNHGLVKYVYIGEDYGELPTPQRTGYTFLGWNGKNMLNLECQESIPSNTALSNSTSRLFVENTYIKGLAYNNYYDTSHFLSSSYYSNTITINSEGGYGIAFPFKVLDDISYTISFDSRLLDRGLYDYGTSSYGILFYNENGEFISNYSYNLENETINRSFTLPAETYYLVVMIGNSNGEATTLYSNIQLEEGNNQTEYEPYYVTSDIKVTEWNTDMVLKAIWQENS